MIGIFGDSVAKGVVFDEARNKYTQLKGCFANLFSQRNGLPITNYARFGCTITKGAEILNKHLGELKTFSHTVLEFGGNDCDFNWREISLSPLRPHLPNVPLPQFEEMYIKMIDAVKAAGSVPVMLSLPPLEPERFLKWVSKGLDRENILKYLGDVGFIYRWHESYSTAVNNLAKLRSICLVDVREAFLKENAYADLLCRDGMHPNEKGHALIGRLLGEKSSCFSG